MGYNRSFREGLYRLRKMFRHPEKAVCNICKYDHYKYAPFIGDRLHIKCLFKKYMNEKLHLSHPVTFSEKLQWLKLYDRDPKYTVMADKAAVKQYVSDIIGSEYIIPTLGIYDSVDKIPFDTLPGQYVIKCTHDSGSTFVCQDKSKIDTEKIKAVLSQKLSENFYWQYREWPYKNIEPKIIVEEYLCDEKGGCPVDFKFFCFNGKMDYFKVDYNRFTNRAANYYNKNCEFQNFGKIHSTPDPSVRLELPDCFEEMVKIAEKLSKNIPFLRVDLYCVKNRIFFGELTFYPSGGFEPFIGDGDIILGELLELPSRPKRMTKR